jgi:hypothetical protein
MKLEQTSTLPTIYMPGECNLEINVEYEEKCRHLAYLLSIR